MTDITPTGPITIEENAGRLTPGAPKITPDSRHIAFTAAMRRRKEDRVLEFNHQVDLMQRTCDWLEKQLV